MSKGFSQEAIDLIQRYSATFHRAYFEWFADRPGEETELVKDIKRRLEENDPCPLLLSIQKGRFCDSSVNRHHGICPLSKQFSVMVFLIFVTMRLLGLIWRRG